MTTQPRLLIIDDDREVCVYLRRRFEAAGFTVRVVHDGYAGLRAAQTFRPDLILLDILMSPLDGKATLARLQELSTAPVIFVTVISDREAVAEGLLLGANDYVTKPFDIRELLARVRTVLRRAPPKWSREKLEDEETLIIDLVSHSVYRSGQVLRLSPTEFRLLTYLIRHADRVVPHEELLQNIWGDAKPATLTTLRAHISLLRKKIEPEPGSNRYIRSAWGIGYEFTTSKWISASIPRRAP